MAHSTSVKGKFEYLKRCWFFKCSTLIIGHSQNRVQEKEAKNIQADYMSNGFCFKPPLLSAQKVINCIASFRVRLIPKVSLYGLHNTTEVPYTLSPLARHAHCIQAQQFNHLCVSGYSPPVVLLYTCPIYLVPGGFYKH